MRTYKKLRNAAGCALLTLLLSSCVDVEYKISINSDECADVQYQVLINPVLATLVHCSYAERGSPICNLEIISP